MDININPSFISLIGILFGILGGNSIYYWSKITSLGLTGNSIVGVFSSVLYIKTIGRVFHLGSHSSFLIIGSIFIGSYIVGLVFVVLTKKVLSKFDIEE